MLSIAIWVLKPRNLMSTGPVGSFLRASMRAVDEQVVMYQKNGLGPRTNLTLGTVLNQTAYLQQLVAVEVRLAVMGCWLTPAPKLHTAPGCTCQTVRSLSCTRHYYCRALQAEC